MKDLLKKSAGFAGEKITVFPKILIAKCAKMSLISGLFITRMGFYPKAQNHYFQRQKGISQLVLIYCTGGKGWLKINNKKSVVHPGDFFILESGMKHSYWADKDDPWTIYWFHLSGNKCNDAINILGGNGINQPYNTGYFEERIILFEKIYATFSKGFSISNLIFANLTFHYFFASLVLAENFQDIQQTRKPETATDKAIDFMRQNISELVTLEEIARNAGLSVSFFSRKFKLETGYAPIEYFNYLKVQKACQLLHFSNTRINEVAAKIGITDPFYFSRLFKKQIGVSPLEYRKMEGIKTSNDD